MHRFPEEVEAHGVCRPCVRKRQLVARVVVSERGGRRVSVAEVLRRISERDARLRAHNAAVMRRVAAASLPQQRRSQQESPDTTKPQELVAPRASTTLNSGGSLGGWSTHGNG